MLGLDNVPPATLRKSKNKNGSVQIWVEHAMTDKEMKQKNLVAPDLQSWNKQLQMMNMFDALIYNTDRNSGNLIITPDWKIWMIDHTRAFRRIPNLQTPGLDQPVRARPLPEAQGARRSRRPQAAEGGPLGLRARRALQAARAARRTLDKLIAERGEDKVLYTFTPGSNAAP